MQGHAQLLGSSLGLKHETVEDRHEGVDPDTLHFHERGLTFIPLRPSHIEFFEAVSGKTAAPFEVCAGRTLVDRNFMPLGLLMCVFEDDGETIRLEGYFGKWWKLYPKDCMRSIHEFANHIRTLGVERCYAEADESIEGASKLLDWLRATPTGHRGELGPIYEIDMFRSRL